MPYKQILKIAGFVVAAIAVIWAGIFVYDLLTAGLKTKARLGANQTDAAVASGQEATSTVGGQSEREAGRARSVAETKGKVNDAENAGDAHNAGADFLCHDAGICPEN